MGNVSPHFGNALPLVCEAIDRIGNVTRSLPSAFADIGIASPHIGNVTRYIPSASADVDIASSDIGNVTASFVNVAANVEQPCDQKDDRSNEQAIASDSFTVAAANAAVEHDAERHGGHEAMEGVQLGFSVIATAKAGNDDGAAVGE